MPPAIETSGLKKRYGGVVALAGIDLAAEEGTVLGLLGPNGAGKTTAVRILTTLLAPDEGSARVLGLDVVADAAELRHQIGLAGQYAAVDESLTGQENLELFERLYQLGRRASRRRAIELLERFDSRTPDSASSRPTPAACGAGSTSPPRSSPGPQCSSSTSRRSTSRRPDWTRAAACRCGRRSPTASPRARPSCSPPSTWRRPTGSPTASR